MFPIVFYPNGLQLQSQPHSVSGLFPLSTLLYNLCKAMTSSLDRGLNGLMLVHLLRDVGLCITFQKVCSHWKRFQVKVDFWWIQWFIMFQREQFQSMSKHPTSKVSVIYVDTISLNSNFLLHFPNGGLCSFPLFWWPRKRA